MSWTQELCLQLIGEYRQHEILWNPRDRLYHHKLKKEEVWIEISKKINMDIEDVKRKMESLKGSYRREKSRVKKKVETGEGKTIQFNYFII